MPVEEQKRQRIKSLPLELVPGAGVGVRPDSGFETGGRCKHIDSGNDLFSIYQRCRHACCLKTKYQGYTIPMPYLLLGRKQVAGGI